MPPMDCLHRELKRKGVTLQLLWYEYKKANPQGCQHSQFCELYRRWARKPAGKASAPSMPGPPGSIMTPLPPKQMAVTRSSSPSRLKLNCPFWTTWASPL